jgi:hypothetical protein
MSILDALREQKDSQQSIKDLAVLPQDQLVRLAQMGQIPPYLLPVLLNEKARTAQEVANLKAAMQGQPQQTVMEQAMQANAQSENPQPAPQAQPMPQEQAPTAAGIGSLPVDGMFEEQNFAKGGIVGYADGGDVKKEEKKSSLKEHVDEISTLLSQPPQTQLSPEEQAYYQRASKGMSDEDKEQQKWMRVMQAGLGMMANKSPYAMQGIAEGISPALQGYASDVAEQRRQEMAGLKTLAEAQKARRDLRKAEVEGGMRLQERLDKGNNLYGNSVAQFAAVSYMNAQKEAGSKKPDAVLLREGFENYMQHELNTRSIAPEAANTRANSLAGLMSQKFEEEKRENQRKANKDALTMWGDLDRNNPEKRKYNVLIESAAREDDAKKKQEFENQAAQIKSNFLTNQGYKEIQAEHITPARVPGAGTNQGNPLPPELRPSAPKESNTPPLGTKAAFRKELERQMQENKLKLGEKDKTGNYQVLNIKDGKFTKQHVNARLID